MHTGCPRGLQVRGAHSREAYETRYQSRTIAVFRQCVRTRSERFSDCLRRAARSRAAEPAPAPLPRAARRADPASPKPREPVTSESPLGGPDPRFRGRAWCRGGCEAPGGGSGNVGGGCRGGFPLELVTLECILRRYMRKGSIGRGHTLVDSREWWMCASIRDVTERSSIRSERLTSLARWLSRLPWSRG